MEGDETMKRALYEVFKKDNRWYVQFPKGILAFATKAKAAEFAVKWKQTLTAAELAEVEESQEARFTAEELEQYNRGIERAAATRMKAEAPHVR